MRDHDQRDALRFNPWDGDDSDYRVLDNRFLVTRVSHECAICFEAIPVGVTVRAQREVHDGKAMTFRFCPTCCKAMLASVRRGDIEPIEARTQLGIINARNKCGGEDRHGE